MHYDPEYLLKRFTDHFKQKYKVECISALHHNKRKTNYHIHLIFAERQLLDKPVEKIATRNMFYDEMGKHRRTKKEILDEAGNIRKRCRVVRKGEMYERKLFTKKNELFKADGYLDEVKRVYTDLINTFAIKEEDKLHVFEKNGMYLATKKVGKNNPKAAEIEADNKVRMQWNQTVDRALISGGAKKDILDVKREKISEEVKHSIEIYGNRPFFLADIIILAIKALELLISKVLLVAAKEVEKVVDIPMYMKDWEEKLNSFLNMTGREVLSGAGHVSAEQAKKHALKQYEIYDEHRLQMQEEQVVDELLQNAKDINMGKN